jgi:hypothetical protein
LIKEDIESKISKLIKQMIVTNVTLIINDKIEIMMNSHNSHPVISRASSFQNVAAPLGIRLIHDKLSTVPWPNCILQHTLLMDPSLENNNDNDNINNNNNNNNIIQYICII